MSLGVHEHAEPAHLSIVGEPAPPPPLAARNRAPRRKPWRAQPPHHLSTRLPWFVAIGLASAIVQGILLLSLTSWGMRVPVATPVAVLTSALVNFSLNYAITWNDRFAALSPAQRRRWFLPLYVVFAITTPTLWLKIGGITLVHTLVGGPLPLIWAASEIAGAIINFVGSDRIAFGVMARAISRATSASPTAERPSWVPAAWRAMRPEQWVKNVFVLAAAPFAIAAGATDRLPVLVLTTLAFCAASSSVYLVNDYLDRERDRLHPTKRHRPIASGALDGRLAIALSLVLAAGAITIGILAHHHVASIVAVYLLLSTAYSLGAKHLPYLDLLLVGGLYGLRVSAGFAACGLDMSTTWRWALLATLLGIAVVTGKRRGEWRMLHGQPSRTRPVLNAYAPGTLPRIYTGVSAVAVVVAALSLWLVTPVAALAAGLIALGFLRFWAAVESDDHDRNPQDLLIADRSLLTLIAGFSGLLAMLLIVTR